MGSDRLSTFAIQLDVLKYLCLKDVLKFYDFENGSGLGEKYFNGILVQEI